MTVHVIAHTHWDREWYLTREQYRARLVDLVDRVLDRMAVEPAFAFFHLDGQTVVLDDYLEVRPERERELRGRIGEGRLLVGPWYVMPDMFLVSGEALVRNLALGLRIAGGFGGAMRVGYMPDPFGHVAQMPQVLAGLGLEGAILWRGFGGRRAEYAWEAPDGTRALLLHLPPEGYCNGLRLPLLPPDAMLEGAHAVVSHERGRSAAGQVLLMVGVDHVEPHPSLLRLVDVVNRLPDTTARMSTLPAYVESTSAGLREAGHELEVVRGELRGGEDYAHLLPGVMSARTYLKQANARVQRELERWAEPMSAFASRGGASADRGLLGYAWKTLLQNHPHDSICGCSIDAVHEENVARFARAEQAAGIVTSRAARSLGARLPPAPPGAVRAIVVNSATDAWSGVIEATVEFPLEAARREHDVDWSVLEEPLEFFGRGAAISAVTDHLGQPVEFQVLGTDEGISHRMSPYLPPVSVRVSRVRLALRVTDVPALGYAALDLHVSADVVPARDPSPAVSLRPRGIENDAVRVDATDVGTVDVLDKRTGTLHRQLFALEDVGDAGDEYNYSPPATDRRVSNAEARDVRVRVVEQGRLVACLLIEYSLPIPAAVERTKVPEGDSARSAETVSLDVALQITVRAGSPAVEGVIRVGNRARDHRLRVLFPTGAATAGHHRADTAFGIIERRSAKVVPPGVLVETPSNTAPMQSFVDAGDDAAGAVALADGLVEYEIVAGPSGAVTAITLLRAVGDLSRGDLATRRGHAGPALATPGAQCQGVHEFRVAFVPRGTPPAAGELYRIARRFLAPPRVFSPCGGDASMAAAGSFFQIAAGAEIVLSACKPADEGGGVVLRVFNAGSGTETVSLSSSLPLAAAFLTDLAERRQQPYDIAGDRVTLTLPPGRIQTIELVTAAF